MLTFLVQYFWMFVLLDTVHQMTFLALDRCCFPSFQLFFILVCNLRNIGKQGSFSQAWYKFPGTNLIMPSYALPDTMLKHLQSVDASRSFSEFRQEASTLHTLQHPCIVALLGISIHPLCFALQLAPLGSLNSVLEERSKGEMYKTGCFYRHGLLKQCVYLWQNYDN